MNDKTSQISEMSMEEIDLVGGAFWYELGAEAHKLVNEAVDAVKSAYNSLTS